MLSKLSSGKEKGQLTTIIRQVLLQPFVECNAITTDPNDWRGEIRDLMKKRDNGLPLRSGEAKKIVRFLIIEDDMYHRG